MSYIGWFKSYHLGAEAVTSVTHTIRVSEGRHASIFQSIAYTVHLAQMYLDSTLMALKVDPACCLTLQIAEWHF